MTGRLHHVSIDTADFDLSLSFYQTLFGMELNRIRGEKPNREAWLSGGIQLCETAEVPHGPGWCGHFAVQVESWPETRARAAEMGCAPVDGKPHWFVAPDGAVIELKE